MSITVFEMDMTARKLVVQLFHQGYSGCLIAREFKSYYGIKVSPQAVNEFLLHYKLTHALECKRGSGRKSIVTPEIRRIIKAIR